MKKIAVVLSGCGFKDGAEITESVSTLISLTQNNAEYKVFAPDMEFQAVNHIDGSSSGTRNILQEAARIARGDVNPLSQLSSNDFDGLAFPGGFGVALHLCSWAQKGANCEVLPDVERVIKEFHESSKPICAICIAPALIARVLGSKGITVTIGEDAETAAEIEKTGAHHEKCAVDDYVTDREFKVITTPAYMYNAKPAQVFKGIQGAIKELVEMA
ncbi:MAG: isoprenoid biosynthesis protein ElbB [Bdellovibrio sp.]|nr:MAG: isoprenoid biosynthesis protein ElbB [Bdellovibrio sp.]